MEGREQADWAGLVHFLRTVCVPTANRQNRQESRLRNTTEFVVQNPINCSVLKIFMRDGEYLIMVTSALLPSGRPAGHIIGTLLQSS